MGIAETNLFYSLQSFCLEIFITGSFQNTINAIQCINNLTKTNLYVQLIGKNSNDKISYPFLLIKGKPQKSKH